MEWPIRKPGCDRAEYINKGYAQIIAKRGVPDNCDSFAVSAPVALCGGIVIG